MLHALGKVLQQCFSPLPVKINLYIFVLMAMSGARLLAQDAELSGATQLDLTLRRQFRRYERLALQARGDLFNIFNHPNFGPPVNYLTSPQFGQATQMLGASLGAGGVYGGLNPLYQIGGPRSVQLALKVLF